MIKSSGQNIGKPIGAGRRPRERPSGAPAAARKVISGVATTATGGRRHRRNTAGDVMRTRIVDAALRTLINEGYANTSARAIAATGSFSPALVFYHFGSVDALLLAVLDRVSDERLARYNVRLAEVASVSGLAEALADLYVEDQRLSYLTAVQEIVGGMAFDAQLGREISLRMQRWEAFGETLAAQILADSPVRNLVDADVIGTAAIALYLGLEIVARMRGGDANGSRSLVTALEQSAPWIDRVLGKGHPASAKGRPKRVEIQ